MGRLDFQIVGLGSWKLLLDLWSFWTLRLFGLVNCWTSWTSGLLDSWTFALSDFGTSGLPDF